MKILHFTLGKVNPERANGVNHVVHGLCKYSVRRGDEIKVIGLSKVQKETLDIIERDGFEVKVYNKFYGVCWEQLKKTALEVDIVHLHSVWQHYNIVFAKYLLSIKKPYIVTIHSGLTDDRIKQSNYYLKLLYHKLFQKAIFDRAAGIHAITKEEMLSISKYTSNRNIFYVQNGVDLDSYKLIEKTYENWKGKVKLGYLGRFSKEKNVKGLIEAISILPIEYKRMIECHLIGPLNKEAEKLKKLIIDKELDDIIMFTGPIYGENKLKKLKDLDFYVHPAFSDVVSIAVMEALGSGLPCVITRTSQVAYFYSKDSFIMVEPIVSDIKRGIMEMIDMQEKWGEISKNSLKLIKDVFNWEVVCDQLNKEYSKITQ